MNSCSRPCHPERSEGSVVRRQFHESRVNGICCRDFLELNGGVKASKLTVQLLAAILVVQGLNAQEKKPWSVNRICGRVEYLQRIPIRNQPNNYSDKRRDLKGIPLELYQSFEGAPCCDGLEKLGSTISGKGGQFEFKPEKAGHHWLTARWNGSDYKVAVEFEPQKKSSTVCSQQGIQMEDGQDASWWETVTVD